nr:unnamed protein product [Spirometra erinaceieuropaei]
MGGFKVKMPHAHLKMGKSGKVKGPKVDVEMPALVVYSPDVSAPAPDLVSSGLCVSSAAGPCGGISVVDSRARSAAVDFGGLDDVDHGSVPAVRSGLSVSTVPSSHLSPPISPLGLSESESSEVESASDTPPFSSPPEFWAHSVTPELGKSYGVHGGASLPRSKEEDLVVSEDLKKVGFRLRWPWSSQKVTPNVTPSLSSQQRKMSSSSSGVVEGSPPNKKRKRPLKPEKRRRKIASEKPAPVGSLSRRDEDLGIQADISTTVQSSAPKFDDTLESGQKRDWSWKRGGRLQQPSAQVQVEEAQLVPLQSSTPSKAIAPDSRPKKHFAGLFKAKSTRKATATVDVREPLQVSIEMRKPSSSSRCSSTEQPQRQTWHAPSINDTEVDSERPPTPPLPCLPDADISKDLAVAYRRYYAYGSPLRRPRPWSTLDFPPRNCKFRNDDNLFPYAITPTKLPSCNWKTDEEYDVPYMDDDALPEEEPEWALGESRRTLTLATADVASFQTSLLAAGEPSEASFEKSPHTKKSLSLRAFSRPGRAVRQRLFILWLREPFRSRHSPISPLHCTEDLSPRFVVHPIFALVAVNPSPPPPRVAGHIISGADESCPLDSGSFLLYRTSPLRDCMLLHLLCPLLLLLPTLSLQNNYSSNCPQYTNIANHLRCQL